MLSDQRNLFMHKKAEKQSIFFFRHIFKGIAIKIECNIMEHLLQDELAH